MKKLLRKSGFTLVEMIVVIAIIGIMLAIVVPLFSISDGRKDEAREYARAFYSNVQELMMDEKLAKNPLPGADKKDNVLVCVEVDGNGTSYNDVLIYMSHSSDFSFPAPAQLVDADPSDKDNKVSLADGSEYKAYEEFATSLRKLQFGNERSGYYFAVVDYKYRVVCAYFVNAADADTSLISVYSTIKGGAFSDDGILDNRYAGAYPQELDAENKTFPGKP